MEVFVMRCAKWLERLVVDDQQRHTHELLELAVIEIRGPRCVQLPSTRATTFQRKLTKDGMRGSMSRKGNCWDAPTDSFLTA
jgi:hypothetical protein